MTEDPRKLDGYVGFANLPNQVHRKSVKRGFEFTIMVVGESGLGKSTLINSLFQTELYEERAYPSAADRVEKTVKVDSTTVDIEEKGVKLRLTVVDSPGFGDAVNNTDCWEEIEKYVDSKFQEYLDDESRVMRGRTVDNRVHACLYFLPPNGHGLRPVDVSFMKQLHNKVNIIPVIAKADTLTSEEVKSLKEKILEDIAKNAINVYTVPLDEEDDPADYEENKAIQAAMPFAVIGSTTVLEVNGKKFRGRQYPWGTISIQDKQYSDFVRLRDFIIRTHYVDLKETTDELLYENFRSQKLQDLGRSMKLNNLGADETNPLRTLEAQRQQSEQLNSSREVEMTVTFQKKVKEKEDKLRDEEQALMEKTKEMEAILEETKRKYEEMAKKMQEVEANNRESAAAGGKKKK